jgi:Protein of unknown function (DUF3800)
MKFFVDESGNTGAGLFDLAQPVFVYAGVWMDVPMEAHFAQFLSNVRPEDKMQDTGELKGSKLTKSDNGREVVKAILDEIREKNVHLCVVVVHKPFIAAAVVVEDCTDYIYDAAYEVSWTGASNKKRPLAEAILRTAKPESLAAAWSARDGHDKTAFIACNKALLAELEKSNDRGLDRHPKRFQGTDFGKIWDDSRNSVDLPSAKWGNRAQYSPNHAAFCALLQEADLHSDQFSQTDVEIVHDQQAQFSQSFKWTWELFANARTSEMHHEQLMRLPLRKLKALSFADSRDHCGIRVCDVLASAVRVAVEPKIKPKKNQRPVFIEALRRLLRQRKFVGDSPIMIGPHSWKKSVFDRLVGIDWTQKFLSIRRLK